MSESQWVNLDEYLCDYYWSKLGPDSDEYDDNLLADAFVTIVQDISDFDSRPKPSLAVMGRDLLSDVGEHGDGDIHYNQKMPYIIAIATEGDQEGAVKQAKILASRLRKATSDLLQSPPNDDNVEYDIIITNNVRLTKYKTKPNPKTGRNFAAEDNYYVLAATALLVESTV